MRQRPRNHTGSKRSARNVLRSSELIQLIEPLNPKRGVEFGTGSGLVADLLLQHYPCLHLITVDHYVEMLWSLDCKQLEISEERQMAMRTLDAHGAHCTLWHMEAHAAAMILSNYRADFVFTDLPYHYKFAERIIPLIYDIVRVGGILAGGYSRSRHLEKIRNAFPSVGNTDCIWWINKVDE